MPYLAALGVSHLHLSPVLEAVPGSTHGYDVVDHARVREELGGEEGLRALAAHRAGARSRPGRWTSCRTTWRCRPAPQPRPVGGAARGPRVAVRALVRHRLGGAGRPGAAAGARRTGSARRSGTWRSTATCCATTTTCSRCARAPRSCRCRELLDAQWYRLGLVAAGPHRAELPALLQHLGADRGAGRGPGGLRRRPTPRSSSCCARACSTGCASTTPTASRTPTAICAGCTRRPAGAGRWWRRSWPDDEPLPAAWPVAGTTGLRRAATRIDGLFTDPAGRGGTARPLPAVRGPAGRPGRRLGGDGAAGRVQGGHPRAGRRGRPADPGRRAGCAPHRRTPRCATTRPGRCGAALQRAAGPHGGVPPVLRQADAVPRRSTERGRRGGAGRRSRCPRRRGAVDVVRGSGARPVRRRARGAPSSGRGSRRPSSALRAKSVEDTRVLPLRAAAVGDRGGRRPRQPGGVPGGLPRLLRARAARLAGRRDRAVHPRHQAQRRRAGGRSRCSPSARSGGRTCWREVTAATGAGRAGPAAGVGGLADGVRARPGCRPGSGVGRRTPC